VPKFLVDESTGEKLCKSLIKKGFDAVYVGDVIRGSKDEEVLKYAEKEDRILITNDKDFGELVFRLRKPTSGVILLRLKKDNPSTRMKYLFSLLLNQEVKPLGKFIVLTERGYRIRKIK
jgi:predicted nuclease of predicted toxin-antitoxin system